MKPFYKHNYLIAGLILLALTFSNSLSAQAINTKTKKETQPLKMVSYFQQSENPHIKPFAYLLAPAVWPRRKIYVCWDNPSDEFSREMNIVRNAISGSWEKYSGLSFVGWGKCAKDNEGVRITIKDTGPYTRGLGQQLQIDTPKRKGVEAGGMVLNFSFSNWSPSCSSTEMKEICIRSTAIHEFGHAIGFSHEHNRPDTPGECTIAPQGGNGNVLLTPYDPRSVMNYCFNIYNKELVLSDLDISAVRQVYGSEQDKSIQKK